MMLESKGDLVAGSGFGSAAQVLAPTRVVAACGLNGLEVRMSDAEALWSVRMREEAIVKAEEWRLYRCSPASIITFYVLFYYSEEWASVLPHLLFSLPIEWIQFYEIPEISSRRKYDYIIQ